LGKQGYLGVDELAVLIVAVTLTRPSKELGNVTVEAVMKLLINESLAADIFAGT